MHVSIMDELDTRAAASEPARMRGVADGRECIGECGRELQLERAGMWSMCGARGQRSPEKNRKSKAACLMSPCGGGGFRAHKASCLSWRHV